MHDLLFEIAQFIQNVEHIVTTVLFQLETAELREGDRVSDGRYYTILQMMSVKTALYL